MSKIKLKPPNKTSTVELIIAQIVEQIRNGTLEYGERLPSEREMVRLLGVGRSTVRESLRALEAMGLIEVLQGKGAFVQMELGHIIKDLDMAAVSSSLQKQTRLNILHARCVVEYETVDLAVQRISETETDGLLQAMREFEVHRYGSGSSIDWNFHNRVHLAIAGMGGNPFLTRILAMLLDALPTVILYKGLFLNGADDPTKRIEGEICVHRALCDAILSGDRARANEEIRKHMAIERKMIEDYFGEE